MLEGRGERTDLRRLPVTAHHDIRKSGIWAYEVTEATPGNMDSDSACACFQNQNGPSVFVPNDAARAVAQARFV